MHLGLVSWMARDLILWSRYFQLQGQSTQTESRKEIKLAQIRIYQELCKGIEECGLCLYTCQKEVFKSSEALNQKGYRPPVVVKENQCTACENCVIFCPDLAIVISGEKLRKRGKK